MSPDGKYVFARDLSGTGWLYPFNGGDRRPVSGLAAEDALVNWSSDGGSIYVYQNERISARVFRLDLSTGARQPVATLAPADSAGLVGIVPVRLTRDGKSYAYSYNRSLSDLFLVSSMK